MTRDVIMGKYGRYVQGLGASTGEVYEEVRKPQRRGQTNKVSRGWGHWVVEVKGVILRVEE